MTLDLIDSLIRVKKEQVALGIDLPTGINFYLTNKDLKNIIQNKLAFKKIKLSPDLLADFRYYSLLTNQNSCQLPLSFTTYYVTEKEEKAVVSSMISWQGKISQQICRHFLDNPQLLNELLISHYWLIEQIGDLLKVKYNNKTFLLVLAITLSATIVIVPLIFYSLSLTWIIELIISVGLILLLAWLSQLLLKKKLPSLILSQLLFGFLAKNTKKRHLGFMLLRYFG